MMSFFKDFKDDFSQAVDEMFPTSEKDGKSDVMVNTLGDEETSKEELEKLDSLLEKVSAEKKADPLKKDEKKAEVSKPAEKKAEPVKKEEKKTEAVKTPVFSAPVKEDKKVDTVAQTQAQTTQSTTQTTTQAVNQQEPVSDEVTTITKGTVIHGNIESTGSLELCGNIEGDVSCRGKLTVTGSVTGNSSAAEVFADAAKIDGEISSSGTVKVGLGSVVIGNVSANSAVIAGAIKGDIDVHGPVVVDTSAVVMGNIKSRSVQINNGAVIEGFCSQCYSDVDMESLFGTKKGKA